MHKPVKPISKGIFFYLNKKNISKGIFILSPFVQGDLGHIILEHFLIYM